MVSKLFKNRPTDGRTRAITKEPLRTLSDKPGVKKIYRKTKIINFSVNHKSAHTNINIDARSNHPEVMKKAIIKDFGNRARSLCTKDTIEVELQI